MIISGRVVSLVVATGLVGATVVSVIIIIVLHFSHLCIGVSEPRNVKIKSDGEYTTISWMPPLDAGNCSIYYSLQCEFDDDDNIFTDTTDLVYVMPRLLPCTYMHVSIWSISDYSGERSEHFAVGQYAETPTIIIAPMLRGAPLKDGTGFNIKWNKPTKLARCDLEYKLFVKTDLRRGNYTYLLSSRSLVVAHRFYCFLIDTKIAAIYNEKQGRYRSKQFIDSHDITGFKTTSNESKVMISWTRHPKAQLCSLAYDVVYQIDGHPLQVQTVHHSKVVFDVVFCVGASIKVTVRYGYISNTGQASMMIYPKLMWDVLDLKITSEDDKRIAIWSVPAEYKSCHPKYHVRVESDILAYDITTMKTEHIVPNNKFCFHLNVHVQVRFRKRSGNYVESGPIEIEVTPPTELKLESSHLNNSVTATWKDGNPAICGVTFKVTNSVPKLERKLSNTKLTFDISYCTTTTIVVTAIGLKGQESAPITENHKEGDPTHVMAVKNVTTKEEIKYLHVYWEKPDFIEHCTTLMFKVTANSDNQTATCLGAVTCHLLLGSYCPVTTLEIKPEKLPGDVVNAYHTCYTQYKSNSVRVYFHKLLFELNIFVNILLLEYYLL